MLRLIKFFFFPSEFQSCIFYRNKTESWNTTLNTKRIQVQRRAYCIVFYFKGHFVRTEELEELIVLQCLISVHFIFSSTTNWNFSKTWVSLLLYLFKASSFSGFMLAETFSTWTQAFRTVLIWWYYE